MPEDSAQSNVEVSRDELHIFDASDRDGIMGDIKIVAGDSKEDAQSKLVDENLQSEFEKHAKEVGDGKYVSETGEDLLGKDAFRHLDGEAVYDGLDYLGQFEEAFGEAISRLSTGRCRSVVMLPNGAEELFTQDERERLAGAIGTGREEA